MLLFFKWIVNFTLTVYFSYRYFVRTLYLGKFLVNEAYKGNVHIIRNTIFQLFIPPPFVTKNPTNAYLPTRLRNKSLNPPPKVLRIMWTFPKEDSDKKKFKVGQKMTENLFRLKALQIKFKPVFSTSGVANPNWSLGCI
jgi:hypothetical protein